MSSPSLKDLSLSPEELTKLPSYSLKKEVLGAMKVCVKIKCY